MKAFKVLIPFLAVGLLVACDKQAPKNGASTPKGNPAPVAEGTGDWGGGNGIDNKVIEKYAMDITTLPEFKEIIEPIGQHLIDIQDEDQKSNPEYSPTPNLFKTFARARTWIFAPVELEVVEKKRLGIEFSKDPVDQLAIQSDLEVWVDSRKYEHMTKEDRAGLLLHELMMVNYRLRFLDLDKMCLLLRNCGNFSMKELFEKHPELAKKYAPEPQRELNRDDYQYIRGATAYLLTKHKEIKTEKDITWFSKAFNFDSRMTVDDADDMLDIPYAITSNDTENMVMNLSTGRYFCDFTKDGKNGKVCRISGSLEKTKFSLTRFDRKNGKTSSLSLLMANAEADYSGVGTERCPSGSGYCVSMAITEDWTQLPPLKIGSRLIAGAVYIKVAENDEKPTSKTIDTIVLRNVVVAFEEAQQNSRSLTLVQAEEGHDFSMSMSQGSTVRPISIDDDYEDTWFLYVPKN